MTEKYTGTKGLTIRIALNRLYEIMDKQPLGAKDEEYYQEAKHLIEEEQNIDYLVECAKDFELLEDKLTAKQFRELRRERLKKK